MAQVPLAPEQQQLLGQLLSSIAPHGWSDVSLTISIVGGEVHSSVVAHLGDGSEVPTVGRKTIELVDVFLAAHEQAYVPGAGSWLTARAVVLAVGRITVDFDYDHEPPFEFAPASWEVELAKRPRAAQVTPAWLAAKAVPTDDWLGVRWQMSFTVDGGPAPRPLDATTTPQGHLWLGEMVKRLTAAGVQVRLGADEGEDADGRPSIYEELRITIGEGYMSLACFAHELSWIADVFPDQCDETTAIDIVHTVITVVNEVTGCVLFAPGVLSYERRILGLSG
ncbi:hypothetical protein [Cellulomonas soli]|uniref:Uncharacterized protein n=1 Tax=Cellulomonas soli TaxID=931535 RepID=A0A512PIY6_9CELL|nr:hypothetical protein [Cellulomonas soli]NYI58240.1 hypothetical protein [Cellulomonas soli]GEP71112.1 hypothetical protein CSO01_38270 [Cellulomonas soli]